MTLEGRKMTHKQEAALSSCRNAMHYDATELGYIVTYYAERSGWTLPTFLKKLEAYQPKPMVIVGVNYSSVYTVQ